MDPRFTSVALNTHGIELRCEACKTIIQEYDYIGNEGQSVFEIVRASLRHVCVNEGK